MKFIKIYLPRLLALLLALGIAASLAGCLDDELLSIVEDALLATPAAEDTPAPTAAPGGFLVPVGTVPPSTPVPAETSAQSTPEPTASAEDEELPAVAYGEAYSDPYDVADYIHLYGELPPNFITKDDAQDLGWISSKGNLWDVAPGMSIGGDRFGNREGLLPSANGRQWYECDVNYEGGFRGAERILYSNDGLIYYTNDHYASYTPVYE